jgi:hypothetical protein
VDCHFTYITTCVDEHKQHLQSYYKLTKDDLEEITKEWSADLLVPADPSEMFDVDSPETMPDTLGQSKMNKNDEVHDVYNMLYFWSYTPWKIGFVVGPQTSLKQVFRVKKS